MDDWIKSLKAGDKVIVSSTYGTRVAEVEKITPSGLIKVDGTLYNQNGCERSQWCTSSIHEATEEAVREVEQRKVVTKAFKIMHRTSQITYEQAIKILEIFDVKEES